MRSELTRRLGLAFGPVEQGSADLAGVPRSVVEHFSQRRAEIVQHMREHGGRSTRAAQVAALETRRAKRTVPVDRLREQWRSRAAEQGLGWVERERLLASRSDDSVEAPLHPDELLDGLTCAHSAFTRRDVVQALAASSREGATVRAIEAEADALLVASGVVRLADDEVAGGIEARYTTPEMLALERELLEGAEARRGEGAARVAHEHSARILAEWSELSTEQTAMVRCLVGSGDGVQVVRAAAGTGKTFALEAARHAWEASDCRVFGCALSARAAAELEAQAGIDATTIARFSGELDRGHAMRRDDVLVVDEAGMVGTRTLARLADHAEETGAKLVLVGDDRQLPELQAGGAFRGLGEHLGAIELREVRRQRHEWDREALAALREGDVQTWAQAYTKHRRIVARPTARGLRAQLVSDWWRASRDRACDAVMIAHRRADVAELNERARALMRATGQLGPDELEVGERRLSVGDRVVVERNDWRLGIVNGQRGEIAGIDLDRRTAQLRLPGGASVELDAGYLDAGHLAHGYALTAHKAQGATVDRAFVLGSDDLYREWGYTALSRHRDEARFYLVSPGSAERCLPGALREPDRLGDQLLAMLGDSHAETLALDHLAPQLEHDDADPVVARFHALTRDEEHRADEVARAERERRDVDERLAELREERAGLGLFARRERAGLDTAIAGHKRALDFWGGLVEQHGAERADAADQLSSWLSEHGEHAATVLAAREHRTAAEQAARLDALRDLLAAHDDRPADLTTRDRWAATTLDAAEPELGPMHAPPMLEIDVGPDLGP